MSGHAFPQREKRVTPRRPIPRYWPARAGPASRALSRACLLPGRAGSKPSSRSGKPRESEHHQDGRRRFGNRTRWRVATEIAPPYSGPALLKPLPDLLRSLAGQSVSDSVALKKAPQHLSAPLGFEYLNNRISLLSVDRELQAPPIGISGTPCRDETAGARRDGRQYGQAHCEAEKDRKLLERQELARHQRISIETRRAGNSQEGRFQIHVVAEIRMWQGNSK
jgi:hypothetical protein